MTELKPCPFCGNEDLVIRQEIGTIKCMKCALTMAYADSPERYEHIGDDIYRKIPKRRGWDIAVEHWNRRINNERT